MLNERVNKSSQMCRIRYSGRCLSASFAPCNDPAGVYCSHCLSNNDTEAQKQEITKRTVLVSNTIKNCVHSSDFGGMVKMR